MPNIANFVHLLKTRIGFNFHSSSLTGSDNQFRHQKLFLTISSKDRFASLICFIFILAPEGFPHLIVPESMTYLI